MIYFSYNDFLDCTENGELDKAIKVEEKIVKYEVKNGEKKTYNSKNQIIKILKDKKQLKIFLEEFLNISETSYIENISYCNKIKTSTDKNDTNNIICKLENKELFIIIKVIEEIDNNISYKMFEHSINIIKRWIKEEKAEQKRYPIVIPIVIYTGNENWKYIKSINRNKINYITYENNKINFSYNMIDINRIEVGKLETMESKIAKELICLKNKYLQIN